MYMLSTQSLYFLPCYASVLYLSHCNFTSTTTLNTFPVTYTKLLIQALPDLCNSYVLEGLGQVEFCASQKWVYIRSTTMYLHGSPAEIQTPAHWNLISCSTTAPPPVVSPSSILRPPSSHCAFIPARKNSMRFKNVISIVIFLCYFLKLTKSEFA
jgi:hypothetical protein